MPNSFALLLVYTWPIVTIILFRKLPLHAALIWSILAGYLFLPVGTGIDLPFLPPIDKNLVPALSAAVMCFVAIKMAKEPKLARNFSQTATQAGDRAKRAMKQVAEIPAFEVKRGKWMFWGLIALLFTSPFLTAIQNPERLVEGTRVLSGMRIYDAFSINLGLAVAVIPFMLGRRFLATEESQKALLRIIGVTALIYSILVLYEVRMSPQLNREVFGFFPHSWRQHLRGEGFRPVVFFHHGLALAIFLAIAAVSVLGLSRTMSNSDARVKWVLAGLWLFAVLFLCRSLGAFLLAFLFCPIAAFAARRTQLIICAVFAGTVLFYPMMRGADLVPVNAIHSLASQINEDRASSLLTRLDNEDRLLAKANEKPLSGWGSWGRSRVYDHNGKDISITDGYWVIIIGRGGWFSYIAQFGLLCAPMLLLGLKQKKYNLSFATAGLGLVLCVALIDLLPNATISPLVWLIAGSMMGFYQNVAAAEPSVSPAMARRPVRAPPERATRDRRDDTPAQPQFTHKRTSR